MTLKEAEEAGVLAEILYRLDKEKAYVDAKADRKMLVFSKDLGVAPATMSAMLAAGRAHVVQALRELGVEVP